MRAGVASREVGRLVAILADLLDAVGGDPFGVTCLLDARLGAGDPENVAIEARRM